MCVALQKEKTNEKISMKCRQGKVTVKLGTIITTNDAASKS